MRRSGDIGKSRQSEGDRGGEEVQCSGMLYSDTSPNKASAQKRSCVHGAVSLRTGRIFSQFSLYRDLLKGTISRTIREYQSIPFPDKTVCLIA
jgi:hypothetical protein